LLEKQAENGAHHSASFYARGNVYDFSMNAILSNALESPIVDERLAVSAAGAAKMFQVSRSLWWKLHAAGKIPLPRYSLGTKATRWDVAELRAWWAAGAPDRASWIKMKAHCLSSK
jgi:predicted DNA-binding transcriptional regulator AlpA